MGAGAGNHNLGKPGDGFIRKRKRDGGTKLLPHELEERAMAYLASLKKGQPPTIAGMCLACDICIPTFYAYQDRTDFDDVFHKIHLHIIDKWEARLWGANSTGSIFWLKNNAGYQDRSQRELSGPDGGPVQFTRVEIVGIAPPGSAPAGFDEDAL